MPCCRSHKRWRDKTDQHVYVLPWGGSRRCSNLHQHHRRREEIVYLCFGQVWRLFQSSEKSYFLNMQGSTIGTNRRVNRLRNTSPRSTPWCSCAATGRYKSYYHETVLSSAFGYRVVWANADGCRPYLEKAKKIPRQWETVSQQESQLRGDGTERSPIIIKKN